MKFRPQRYAVITPDGVRAYEDVPLHLLLDRYNYNDDEWQICRPKNGQLVARKRDLK